MPEVPLNRAALSLGSNIDKERNLATAVRLLAEVVRVTAVSSAYETDPVGNPSQERFLNAAVLVETPLSADALKREVLRPIEDHLGRRRTADKNAPRTIDIDIAIFNDAIQNPEVLTRPHAAVPLAEIAPDFRPASSGKTLAEAAVALPQAGVRRRPDLILIAL